MKKIWLALLCLISAGASQAQIYGPYFGASVFINKSNLFNSDDFRADSFQHYQITPGFAGSFDFGYLYESGFSIQSGLQFGTCNQKYVGEDNYYTYDLKGTTKTSYLKIPVVFGIEKMTDRRLKFLYNVGFYYALNTGYSDSWTLTNKIPDAKGNKMVQSYTVKNDEMSYNNSMDTSLKYSYALDKRPYQRHGLGVLAGVGVRYQLKEKLDLVAQLKGEFTFTNAEITQEVRFTPINDPTEFPKNGHVYSNYAKYMNDPNKNWNRAATHPFNVGLQLSLRYYIFDF